MDTKSFDLGYAIGIIATRASFTLDRKSPVIQIKAQEYDSDILEAVKAQLGGKILGPYRGILIWQARKKDCASALKIIKDYLPDGAQYDKLNNWMKRLAKIGISPMDYL